MARKIEAHRPLAANHPLIRKLSRVVTLDETETEALLAVCADVRAVGNNDFIARDGQEPTTLHLMVEGWAARVKHVPGGARQITALLLPGDFCDLHGTLLKRMDHSIVALSSVRVAHVTHPAIDTLMRTYPAIERAFRWTTLVDEATLRAWIVSIGRRDARGSVAHLMCELLIRLDEVGLVADGRFALPLTQEEIGDALGLTPVHVNRMLNALKAAGLLQAGFGKAAIFDPAGLAAVAGFDPAYLHLDGLK